MPRKKAKFRIWQIVTNDEKEKIIIKSKIYSKKDKYHYGDWGRKYLCSLDKNIKKEYLEKELYRIEIWRYPRFMSVLLHRCADNQRNYPPWSFDFYQREGCCNRVIRDDNDPIFSFSRYKTKQSWEAWNDAKYGIFDKLWNRCRDNEPELLDQLDILPKYFVVKNPEKYDRRRKEYVMRINDSFIWCDEFTRRYDADHLDMPYLWYDWNEKRQSWTAFWYKINEFENNPALISLDEREEKIRQDDWELLLYKSLIWLNASYRIDNE